MEKHFRYFVFLLVILLPGFEGINGQEEKFKAIFIYNFAKYIDWSANTSGDFNIAIVGKDPIEQELKTIAAQKKVGNKPVVIKTYSASENIDNAQIIYVSDRVSQLDIIVNKAKDLKSLVVCSAPNSCKNGAAINFVLKNGNLNFEISKKNIEMCGLNVNPALVSLGTQVE